MIDLPHGPYTIEIGSFCLRFESIYDNWFEENSQLLLPLVEEKRSALIAYKNSPSIGNLENLRMSRSRMQTEARKCAQSYWLNICDEIQRAADMGDTRKMYQGIKRCIGPAKRAVAPLKDLQGNILTGKQQKLECWVEHYGILYTRTSDININEAVLATLPQFEIMEDLSTESTLEELQQAINSIPVNKASGNDSIPAEIYKCANKELLTKIHQVLLLCCREDDVPQDFKDARFIQLYKNKGDRSECDNHRGIFLLNIIGKIFSRILLPRVQILGENMYPESQCGFRQGRSTTDMVFSVRQLQEKCREKRVPLHIAFIDLTKAFDSVSREGLYIVLRKVGCPQKLLNLIRSLHMGMMATVAYENEESKAFPVNNGVRQGCVLAPVLFNIYFSYLIRHAFEGNDEGIYLISRHDGGLFNISRFRAKTKVREMPVRELLFADDVALVAHSEESLQRLLDKFSESCKSFGLRISLKKTVIMHQGSVGSNSEITLDRNSLSSVDKFCYLGSTITKNLDLNDEISKRISKAAMNFGLLKKRAWENNRLSTKVKIHIHETCVLSSFLRCYTAQRHGLLMLGTLKG